MIAAAVLDPLKRKTQLFALLVTTTLAIGGLGAGCDWVHYSFMNAIPFKGNPKANPDIYVYLAIDGLSYATTQELMKEGAFPGNYHLSKFITMFPGTSDASWTRIMHTEKLGGYEIEYYSPRTDSIHNEGLSGLAKHIMPAVTEGMSFEAKYLSAFDYRANGYLHAAYAYSNTDVSLADTIDNLFDTIGGRSQTQSVISAYLLEFDVLGHMRSSAEVAKALRMLANRITKFKRDHPERRYHFTIFSDHGMNFTQIKGEKLIHFGKELEKVGVKSVKTLGDPATQNLLAAVAIEHTRVTYVALHTVPSMGAEVASLVAKIPSVDLAISKLTVPDVDPRASGLNVSNNSLEWYAIFADSARQLYFGFDSAKNEYYLPREQNYARLDLALDFAAGEIFKVVRDADLFALTKNQVYPDLFFRTRTALSPVGAEYPADVMVSFRPMFAEIGFTPPGKDDIASSGFHGAMEKYATLGTLLTDEREIPDAVRSDNLFDLFPRLREHTRRFVDLIPGDPNASL